MEIFNFGYSTREYAAFFSRTTSFIFRSMKWTRYCRPCTRRCESEVYFHGSGWCAQKFGFLFAKNDFV